MNRRFFYFFLLLLGMAVTFVGCEADIEEDPENTVFCNGVVEAESLDVSHFSVSSLIETSTVLDNRFSVKATSNGKLQMLFVSNKDDEPVMLYRGVISGDSSIVIDAHSTALAALTFHPALATIGYDKYSDYEELVEHITTRPHFAEYEGVVAQTISQNRDIFDTANTQFISLYAKVMDEICGDTSLLGHTASKATSPLTELYGCWPIDVTANGRQLSFRMPGCSPTYWCDVHDKDGREVGKFTVPTRDNFGVWDLVKRAFTHEDLLYGDAVSWTFPEYEENYTFHFDRGGLTGRLDQYGQILKCVLQAIGVTVDDTEISLLLTVMSERMSQDLSILETGSGSLSSAIETVCQTAFQIALEQLSDPNSTLYRKAAVSFAKFTLGFLKVVDVVEGAGNAILRTVWNFRSELEYYFCSQCNAPNDFSMCRPRLSVFSGNNQRGNMGETLAEQIVVEVTAPDYSNINNYRVKFEPQEDCGSVSHQWSDIDDNSFLANTDWTLGPSRMGTQKLFAMLYDKSAGKFIDTVIFNADAEGEHFMVSISCESQSTPVFSFPINVGGNIENNVVNVDPTTVQFIDYNGGSRHAIYHGTYNILSHQLYLQVAMYNDNVNNNHYRTDDFSVILVGNSVSGIGTLVYDNGAGCTLRIDMERTNSKTYRVRKTTSDKDYHYDVESCATYRE